MASETEIRTTLTRYAQFQADNDMESWLALFTDNAVQIDPIGTPERRGRDGLTEGWHLGRSQAPTMIFNQQDIVVCDHEAVLVLTVRCTDPKGRPFDVRSIDVFRFAPDARITEVRAFWNRDRVYYPLTGLQRGDLP
jgi:steroid Delta-isomerase